MPCVLYPSFCELRYICCLEALCISVSFFTMPSNFILKSMVVSYVLRFLAEDYRSLMALSSRSLSCLFILGEYEYSSSGRHLDNFVGQRALFNSGMFLTPSDALKF